MFTFLCPWHYFWNLASNMQGIRSIYALNWFEKEINLQDFLSYFIRDSRECHMYRVYPVNVKYFTRVLYKS